MIAAGTTIKIALDDITLPTSPTTVFYFGFELNFITNSGTTTASYVKAKRIITNVFPLTGTVSVTPDTSGSFPPTSTTYGDTGISMQYAANFTNPLLINGGNMKPHKLRIRYSGGFFSMAANTFIASKFYERTSPGWAATYAPIWINLKTRSMYTETQNTTNIQP